jgi:hypothetical protein
MDDIAKSQIELNKQYGKRLVIIAWCIEIIAASLGLFIGVINALATIEYYNKLDEAVIIGTTFSNVFVAAAPFVIIAAVELTKIPLALGFYRVKRLAWRLLFLSTLFLLIFVTFETMFNGLERQFSGLEAGIEESRGDYLEKVSQLNSINQRIQEIDKRTLEQIDIDYQEKISKFQTEGRQGIQKLSAERDKEIAVINQNRKTLLSNYTAVADARGVQQKVNRLIQEIENARVSAVSQIDAIKSQSAREIEDVDIAIQQINQKETEELLNTWAFGRGGVRNAADEQRKIRIEEKVQIQKRRDSNILKIENEREAVVRQKNIELNDAETELSKSQGRDSGNIETALESYASEAKKAGDYYEGLIIEKNREIAKTIENLNAEKESLKEVQRIRELSRPGFEDRRLKARDELITIRSDIDEKASQLNVYRIAVKIYTKKDDGTPIQSAADLELWQISMVQYIWFGSIGLVAALVGTIIALAGFALQDPESYKPILHKKRPFRNAVRGILIRLRKFYTYRKTGVLRTTLRSLLVDIRRWVRAPRIKYEKVKVPHEVIKEVPGPEKVVYKEVPKEIIKNEIVYVPLYSVEEGTVVKDKVVQETKESKDD